MMDVRFIRIHFPLAVHLMVEADEKGRVAKSHNLRFAEFVSGFSRSTWRRANCLTMEINRITREGGGMFLPQGPRFGPTSLPPLHFWIVSSSDRWYRHRFSLPNAFQAMRNSGLTFPLTYFRSRVNGGRELERCVTRVLERKYLF